MVEGFISQFNQPFLSSVKRACSLKRCQEVWLHLLDQCRVNSTHILVHFVEFFTALLAVMVWWFRPGPGSGGGSNRLLITKKSPLPFFGAMLAFGIASELRRGPTIGMYVVGWRGVTSSHGIISSRKRPFFLLKKRRDDAMANVLFFIRIPGYVVAIV